MSRSAARALLILVLACGCLAGGAAGARDLFVAQISIDGQPVVTRSTNRARDIPELFDNGSLLEIDPGYDPNDPVSAGVDLRGLAASLSYSGADTALRLVVPGAGIDVSFDGGSRDASEELLENFLKGDFEVAGLSATDLVQALVAHSPVDPVAGNPNSLQSRMFAADFRMGTSGSFSSWAEGWPLPNLVSLDLGGGAAPC